MQQLDLADLHRLAARHPHWVVLGYCNAPRIDHGPPLCSKLPAGTPEAGGVVAVEARRLDRAAGD